MSSSWPNFLAASGNGMRGLVADGRVWTLFFASPIHHKIVILVAERLTDCSRDTVLGGAESKDPDGALFARAVWSFSTTAALLRICALCK
jgi:hypothetical protein